MIKVLISFFYARLFCFFFFLDYKSSLYRTWSTCYELVRENPWFAKRILERDRRTRWWCVTGIYSEYILYLSTLFLNSERSEGAIGFIFILFFFFLESVFIFLDSRTKGWTVLSIYILRFHVLTLNLYQSCMQLNPYNQWRRQHFGIGRGETKK